jgi:hypothetical protein
LSPIDDDAYVQTVQGETSREYQYNRLMMMIWVRKVVFGRRQSGENQRRVGAGGGSRRRKRRRKRSSHREEESCKETKRCE